MLSNSEILERLKKLIQPDVKNKLRSRGLARSLIWREGKLPSNTPHFSELLSYSLESHAFQILELTLSVDKPDCFHPTVLDAYCVAAEELESIVRRGDTTDSNYGFFIVVAGAAYQLARLGARSYVVLPPNINDLIFSTAQKVLAFLLRRDFTALSSELVNWSLSAPTYASELEKKLQSPDLEESNTKDESIAWLLTDNYIRAIGHFDLAVRYGDLYSFKNTLKQLERGLSVATEAHHITLWWIHRLTIAIVNELWETSIWNVLPTLLKDELEASQWNKLRLNYIKIKLSKERPELDMWPSQLEAAKCSIDQEASMVIALPTSAGKTKIAELCILRALSLKTRVFYITPLRSLSAQVESLLQNTFGKLGYSVSSLYGASGISKIDVDIAQSNEIVVATPEKLDYVLRVEPDTFNDVGLVVLDEGHMIGIGVREIRYETLVQRMLKRSDASSRRIVCLSAIFDNGESLDNFVEWISRGNSQAIISSKWRPTRQRAALCKWDGSSAKLIFDVDGEKPYIPKYISKKPYGTKKNVPSNRKQFIVLLAEKLVEDNHSLLVYCPERRFVESAAKEFLNLTKKQLVQFPLENSIEIQRVLDIGIEWLGAEHLAILCLKNGIGMHHSALPRPFLFEIEKLINSGKIKIIIASPTIAQGLDLSCSALIFYSLYRGGEKIPASEFTNVVGRVGRAFVDIDGLIIFPVYDESKRKIDQFLSLWKDMSNKPLESGLYELIARIISILSRKFNVSGSALLEKIVNIDFDWRDATANFNNLAGGASALSEEESLEGLLSQLDESLLSMIDPQIELADLAEVLDDALGDSFWQRRLMKNNKDTSTYQQQRQILISRAKWIWSHSDSNTRQGLFLSGIGFSVGNLILEKIEPLSSLIVMADEAIANFDITSAVPLLSSLIKWIHGIHHFKIKLPVNWELLLEQWLKGEPVWGKDKSADIKGLEFIFNGVVYSVILAIETIRSIGVKREIISELFIPKALTASLTYGCCFPFGRWLLQYGLPSREMAIEISKFMEKENAIYSDHRVTFQHLNNNNLIHILYYEQPEKLRIWESFLAYYRKNSSLAWEERNVSGKIKVSENIKFHKNELVRLVKKTDAVASIFTSDMDKIADIKVSHKKFFSGYVTATMATGGNLELVSYGPVYEDRAE